MGTDTQQEMYYGPTGGQRHPDAEEHPESPARHEAGPDHAPEAEPATADARTPGEEPAAQEPTPPEPAGQEAPTQAPPTQAPPTAEPMPAILLWDEARTGEYRGRWRDAQLRFVDDPKAAATEARTLVAEVVDALSTALTERRDRLDDWRTGEASGGDETERLRIAMRHYRDFFERVLGI